MIGVFSNGTELALIVAFFSSRSAAAGGGGVDAVHASGGRRVADGGATDTGGGIGRDAIGGGAGGDPGGVRGCLALAFREIADQPGGRNARLATTRACCAICCGAICRETIWNGYK